MLNAVEIADKKRSRAHEGPCGRSEDTSHCKGSQDGLTPYPPASRAPTDVAVHDRHPSACISLQTLEREDHATGSPKPTLPLKTLSPVCSESCLRRIRPHDRVETTEANTCTGWVVSSTRLLRPRMSGCLRNGTSGEVAIPVFCNLMSCWPTPVSCGSPLSASLST
ncbi:hypothetical protein OG21DRAFT_160396 [Imleria badia]|nr:hypothetical protein OG21DRAFT_160396 [Imleria badia]